MLVRPFWRRKDGARRFSFECIRRLIHPVLEQSLIKVLARQLSVTITEWINPATCPWTDSERISPLSFSSVYDVVGLWCVKQPYPASALIVCVDCTSGKLALPYTAPIQEFKDFLQRTERYPSLVVSDNSGKNEGGKRIVLVEDLPYLGHEPALRTFQVWPLVSITSHPRLRLMYDRQELLREHLRAPTARFPLVLIISDDSFGNSPLFRLLPQDVMAHSAFSLIKYAKLLNGYLVRKIVYLTCSCVFRIAGVPPTRAAKVLAKIAGLEGWTGAGKAARGKATGVNALAKVCAGDLRSAINSLQLLSRSGGQLTYVFDFSHSHESASHPFAFTAMRRLILHSAMCLCLCFMHWER